MPKGKTGVASALDLTNHEKEGPKKAHGIWDMIRSLLPGGISARVYLSADWTLTYNAWAVVPFNTVLSDTGDMYDETTDHEFTIATPGLYLVTGHVDVHQGTAAARDVQIGVYVNDSLSGMWGRYSTSIETVLGFSGATLLSLAAGDFVDIRAYQGGAGTAVHAHGGQALTYCGLIYMGPA